MHTQTATLPTGAPQKSPQQITGRMVLIGFILFFGLISVVNGIFMYMALQTWPGLTTEHAYKDGIKYNETLADAERQAALGWKSQVAFSDDTLSIFVTSKQGAAVSNLDLNIIVVRPLGSEEKIVLRAVEAAPGEYRSPLILPATGRWKIDVTATGRDGEVYRMRHEVLVNE